MGQFFFGNLMTATLLLCKMYVFDIFNMIDLFQILVSRSIIILISILNLMMSKKAFVTEHYFILILFNKRNIALSCPMFRAISSRILSSFHLQVTLWRSSLCLMEKFSKVSRIVLKECVFFSPLFTEVSGLWCFSSN